MEIIKKYDLMFEKITDEDGVASEFLSGLAKYYDGLSKELQANGFSTQSEFETSQARKNSCEALLAQITHPERKQLTTEIKNSLSAEIIKYSSERNLSKRSQEFLELATYFNGLPDSE